MAISTESKRDGNRLAGSPLRSSPQSAPSSRELVHRLKLSSPVRSDVNGKVGAAFRLRFRSLRNESTALPNRRNDLASEARLSPPSHRSDTTPTKSRQSRRSAPCPAHPAKRPGDRPAFSSRIKANFRASLERFKIPDSILSRVFPGTPVVRRKLRKSARISGS
jgi:hypothetical protein